MSTYCLHGFDIGLVPLIKMLAVVSFTPYIYLRGENTEPEKASL
jgi:hypothetical protein